MARPQVHPASFAGSAILGAWTVATPIDAADFFVGIVFESVGFGVAFRDILPTLRFISVRRNPYSTSLKEGHRDARILHFMTVL